VDIERDKKAGSTFSAPSSAIMDIFIISESRFVVRRKEDGDSQTAVKQPKEKKKKDFP